MAEHTATPPPIPGQPDRHEPFPEGATRWPPGVTLIGDLLEVEAERPAVRDGTWRPTGVGLFT